MGEISSIFFHVFLHTFTLAPTSLFQKEKKIESELAETFTFYQITYRSIVHTLLQITPRFPAEEFKEPPKQQQQRVHEIVDLGGWEGPL